MQQLELRQTKKIPLAWNERTELSVRRDQVKESVSLLVRFLDALEMTKHKIFRGRLHGRSLIVISTSVARRNLYLPTRFLAEDEIPKGLLREYCPQWSGGCCPRAKK